MCGIAGYFGTEDIPKNRVDMCLHLMRRRGPDHADFRRWRLPGSKLKNLLFLHSRLSIIDLDSRANQPFCIADKWIILNGELYNYIERREDLTRQGYSFKTASDTEVLLSAIDHYGLDILDKCEGMWSFAFFDETKSTLTLSRDRFGEKPLYLYRDPTGIYFGSEAKFIFSLLGHRLEIDLEQVNRYLINGYKSLYKEGHTFFKGLKELPPATNLCLDSAGQEKIYTYWKPCYLPDENISYDDAVTGARERLIHSVKLRLRADVPLAFCMSGGVDSNALISIAKKIFNYNVHGFTITSTDPRYDERELVNGSIAELGIRHTAIPVDTKNFLTKLRQLVLYHDAPVYTITYYAHWLLQESIASHGYRISVSGTAADELFTGYYDHHLMYLYELKNDPTQYFKAKKAWEKHIKPFVQNPYLSDPELFLKDPFFRDHIYLEAIDFRKYLRKDWDEHFYEHKFTENLLRNRTMNELFYEAIPVILHEDDLNAMYFSIENRSPFLDRELFEFCHRIPVRHLIQNGAAKAVLRDAVRGIVPDNIVDNRRKVGFNASIYSFLDVKNPEVRASFLDESPIFDFILKEKIETLIEKSYLPNSESKFLFYFLSTKMFLEEFS